MMKYFALLRFIIRKNIIEGAIAQGGIIMAKIDRYIAARIAEGMNTWAGKDHRKQIITADEVLKLSPIPTSKASGYVVYAYQWGDVTLLACVFNDGHVRIQHTCW